MKHSNLMVAFLVTLLSLPSMIYAQKEFTLEDLNFGGKNYHNMVPENRYLTWWGDELVRNDAQACYIVDKKTGEETQLFTLDEIAGMTQSSEQNRMRHLYNASFPKGGETVVALINGQERILLNWKSGECKKYNRDKVDAEDWCAASGMMAVVKDHNLFVVDDQGKKSQLSTDGSREIVYGQSVHRDEFGIEKGTFWSPDGKRLAFYRMDQSMVSDYPQVDIFNRVATYQPDKYPMAGETSHQVTVGVYDTTNDKTVYLQAGDPTDRYFTNIAWSPDSKVIYMFELNRDQNDCRLTSYDAVSGKPLGELYQEKNDKYVEPLHPIVFLPWDSNKFIFQSQRDGFNHLYLYDLKKKAYSQLTHGRWVVMELLGFNTKDKSVVIASNECSPIQRNLFSVNIKTGKRKLLDNGRGYHAGVLSESGLWLYDKYSEPDVPRNINVCQTATAKNIQIMSAKDPWQGYQVPEYSCGTIKAADGTTDLYYRMVKPVHFDPTKKYPTVIYVYGGPHAHNVDARWHYSSRSWETYMAQKGYLLFILDNRGSENRGRDFEQVTFRQLGQIEMQDQMKGVEFLKSLPYVDPNRMGVHGWSFGGYMTITMMTNHPEVFKVGVAGGPVIDWKWYEVMYGERYMDTPQSNPEGYAKTSLLAKAKDLKGKLQIITGYNDATVVPQHCLSFLAECIDAGTHPDFFVYPGEPHNMRGHQSVHLHERITQYFEDYLKP
ncbi:MAG: DPP IV N-terminal domain-containing protein [Prevotella sp.]|nr:DPP IV N-terminal domain-containing protein [Prevotella sp.]